MYSNLNILGDYKVSSTRLKPQSKEQASDSTRATGADKSRISPTESERDDETVTTATITSSESVSAASNSKETAVAKWVNFISRKEINFLFLICEICRNPELCLMPTQSTESTWGFLPYINQAGWWFSSALNPWGIDHLWQGQTDRSKAIWIRIEEPENK